MRTIIISILSIFCFLSNKPLDKNSLQANFNTDKYFEIRYEDLLKKKNNISLSQLASKVEYIRLETNENCMINNIAKYYFSDNFIFVQNKDHILKFSSDGKFIKQIGTPGRGPGEITSIWTTSIIPEKKLIVIHDGVAGKLRYFNFDGNLINTVNLPSNLSYVKVLNSGGYIAINQESFVSEKNTHLLFSESGEILSVIKNYILWKNSSPIGTMILINSFEPFYTYQNKYYLKSLYNDTVYVVKSNKIIPSYYIDLGKYKLPEEKRIERLSPEEAKLSQKNASKYCFSYVLEAGNRFFLTTNNFGNQNIERFIINKKGLIANTDNRYSAVFRGYIDNDWDGGTLFWPKGSIDDNTVFMPIYVADLKKILKFRRSSISLKTVVKFPEKRNHLEKIASDMDIANNPILMIVTLNPEI